MSNKIKKKLNTFTLILLAAVLFVSCPLIAYAAALQSNFSLGGNITYEYKNKVKYEYLNVEDFFVTDAETLEATNAENWNKYSNKVEGTEFVIDARGIAPEIGEYIYVNLYDPSSNQISFSGTVILGGDVNSISPIAFSYQNKAIQYYGLNFYIDTLIIDIYPTYELYDFSVIDFSGITVRQLFIGGDGYGWPVAPTLSSLPNTIETFVCEAPISQVEDGACSGCRALSVFDADLSGCGYIGYQAFYNCVNMPMPTDITPGTTIEQDAFANVCFPRRKIRNTDTGKIHEGYIVDGSTIDALINGYYNDWQQAISFVPDYIPASITTVDDYMEFVATSNSLYQQFRLYTDSVIYITYEAIERLNEMLGYFDVVLNMLDAFYLSDISLAYIGSFEISTAAYATGLGHFYQLPYANVLIGAPIVDIAESVIPQLFANDYNYLSDARYIDNLDEHLDIPFDVTRNDMGEANGVVYTREQYPILYNTYFEYVEEYSYPVIRNYVDCL